MDDRKEWERRIRKRKVRRIMYWIVSSPVVIGLVIIAEVLKKVGKTIDEINLKFIAMMKWMFRLS